MDKVANGFNAHEKRFTMSFDGPLIPMGAEVRYMPISAKDKARTHKFGDKLLNGIFAGYGQHAGGRWDKTLLLADWEELQKQEIASQVRVKRFKAGEVHPVKVAEGVRISVSRRSNTTTGNKFRSRTGFGVGARPAKRRRSWRQPPFRTKNRR